MPARLPDAVRTNRLAWDATVLRHARFRGDEAARLRGGEDPSDLTAMGGEALRLLGELRGKTVLHALCNHGDVTVALSRRCRAVHGVDLSPAAVREARSLARRTGSRATFETADVLEFLGATRRRFDVVVALWGVLCWLRDLESFARGVRRVLRPGGRLVLLDGHPALNSSLGAGGPADTYFRRAGETATRERMTLDYVGAGGGVEVEVAWWRWTLGDLVTAVARAGLVVEELREHEGCHPDYWGTMVPVERDAGACYVAGRRGLLPQSFSLCARRP